MPKHALLVIHLDVCYLVVGEHQRLQVAHSSCRQTTGSVSVTTQPLLHNNYQPHPPYTCCRSAAQSLNLPAQAHSLLQSATIDAPALPLLLQTVPRFCCLCWQTQLAACGCGACIVRTFQVACNLCYAVVVEQQHLQPWQAWEALQPHNSIV